MSEADLAFAPRPGLTAWLGASLLLASISSALAWSQGVVTLPAHLVTTVPMLYFVFICIHDGVHGALNRDRRVSDAIAWVMGSITVLPFPLLRQARHRVLARETGAGGRASGWGGRDRGRPCVDVPSVRSPSDETPARGQPRRVRCHGGVSRLAQTEPL